MPAIKSFIGESSGNINYDRRYSLISIVNYGIISLSSPFRITHFFNIKRPCPLITGVLLLHENENSLCLDISDLYYVPGGTSRPPNHFAISALFFCLAGGA